MKKNIFFLHSTATNHANDETEEKEEHLQTFFFHSQNKTTANLNLRIKEATLKILKKNVNLHFQFDDDEKHIWCPIKEELDYRLLIQV